MTPFVSYMAKPVLIDRRIMKSRGTNQFRCSRVLNKKHMYSVFPNESRRSNRAKEIDSAKFGIADFFVPLDDNWLVGPLDNWKNAIRVRDPRQFEQ